MREIVLDTLGKLEEYGHGIGGYCLDCRRLFDTSLAVLILERGRDYSPIPHGAAAVPGVWRAAHAVQHHRAIEGWRVGLTVQCSSRRRRCHRDGDDSAERSAIGRSL
jgi:hypothetical protein